MIKSKKQMYLVIGVFALVLLLGTTTYAFFNYTRTGSSNVIKTGRISFTSSQDGNINLTNVFPISSSDAETDTTNTDEVVITITGDTTYSEGIEYLVTLEDVNIETSTNKKIPISIIVTPEADDTELGTANDNYFNTGVRGGNTSYYKVLADDTIEDGEYVLVGYIRPGQAEVNGKIGIKAYLDASKILISDTYDGTESNEMGTPNSLAQGKTVLTSTEWNSIQGNNAISFKVRIEANEGIWVPESTNINRMMKIPFDIFDDATARANVEEIYFIRETPIRMQRRYEAASIKADLTDETLNQGKVLAWQEENKLYIASTGTTYFPENCTALFAAFNNVEKIEFNNINTSDVTSMQAMFVGRSHLTSVDISGFDTSSVTDMSYMFNRCSSVENVNLSGLGSNNLTNIGGIFNECTNLKTVNMSGFNFGIVSYVVGMFENCMSLTTIDLSNANTSSVTNMANMFYGCSSLTNVNLTGIDTSNVTVMARMFENCMSLTTIDLSSFDTSSVTYMYNMFAMGTKSGNTWTPSNNNLTTIKVGSGWNTNNVTNSTDMFYNNTHLVGGSGTIFDTNYTDKEYARVDGGPSNPGYLTLKTN